MSQPLFRFFGKVWDPDTSYHVHFIFCVTSYQREQICSLHPIITSYHNHFILRVVSYQESFHTISHFIPSITSYHVALHTKVTSALHTKVSSYRNHFIPRSLHTIHFILSFTSYRIHFIIVISCRPLYTSPVNSDGKIVP